MGELRVKAEVGDVGGYGWKQSLSSRLPDYRGYEDSGRDYGLGLLNIMA